MGGSISIVCLLTIIYTLVLWLLRGGTAVVIQSVLSKKGYRAEPCSQINRERQSLLKMKL